MSTAMALPSTPASSAPEAIGGPRRREPTRRWWARPTPADVGDRTMVALGRDGGGAEAVTPAVEDAGGRSPVVVVTWVPTTIGGTWGEVDGDAWRNAERVRRALHRTGVVVRSHRGPLAGLAREAERHGCRTVVVPSTIATPFVVGRLRRRLAARGRDLVVVDHDP